VTRKTAIIVVGFNRPEYLIELLEFLSINDFQNIFVSIDSNKEGHINDEIKALAASEFSDFSWIFRDSNLGIGKHVPTVVSEVLENFDNCVVLEDDVRVSAKALNSGINLLSQRLPENYMTIGFFGGVWFKPWKQLLFGRNCWRETEYFSAWGWGIQRESWSKYSHYLKKELIELQLANSDIWNQKTPLSQKRWLRRFKVVAESPDFSWDFQMQYATYVSRSVHLLPTFSAAENCGFDDYRSTNTKSRKPRWHSGRKLDCEIEQRIRKHGLNQKILLSLDKLTWAGDLNLHSLVLSSRLYLRKIFS
jgi:hypothetical protein